ncbi:MAPEG-domain-containing protein [Rhizoclosmatium globosum]|uniref:Glutathione S-transferase 3, mitochondrial n=1 Tax=Rhizoclosmatium globosum TaxID=329046 RepID=A0A1Y2CVB4_9FUNG|nr:MAPEG-domain-containing protein [Rhizoclosmatium globosum]|eukprot:ORY50962.1 MAPEG-domain-containing protein [Rhizoclosmatium globosum]
MPGQITLLPEFGYVIAVGTLSTIYPVILGGQVGAARKRAGVPYPHMYATQLECAENKNKHIFNCFQRAHHNYLENYPQFLFLLATAGIEHPVSAAVAGSVWLVGRALFAKNYQSGDPTKRNSGFAWIHYIGLTALLGMSLKSAKMVKVSVALANDSKSPFDLEMDAEQVIGDLKRAIRRLRIQELAYLKPGAFLYSESALGSAVGPDTDENSIERTLDFTQSNSLERISDSVQSLDGATLHVLVMLPDVAMLVIMKQYPLTPLCQQTLAS